MTEIMHHFELKCLEWYYLNSFSSWTHSYISFLFLCFSSLFSSREVYSSN